MHLRVINGGLSQNPGKAKTISPKKNIPRFSLLNELIEKLKIVSYSDYEDLKEKVYGTIGACADKVERRRLNHKRK